MPGSPKKESNGSPLSLGRGGAQIAPKTLPPIGAPAAAPSPGAPSMPGAGSGVLRPASGARKRTAFSVSAPPSPGGGMRPMSAGRRPSHGVQRARSESTLVAKRKVSRMPSAGGPPDLTRAPTMGERAMSRLSQFFSDDESASPSFQPASPGMEPIATRHVRDDAYLIEMVSAADLSGLILPTSRLRVFWDMMTMAMVMYTAISLPVVVVYPDFEVPVALTVFEIAMDVIFILDIGLNFRTAFVEDAVLIVDKQRIMRKYARKWLAIDVVGSIPWEIIFAIVGLAGGLGRGGGDSDVTELLTIIKVLKVPKMLRLGRLFKFLERFEGAANAGRIFLLMLLMTLIVHWISCLWYLFARSPGGFLDQHGPGSDAAWYDQYLFNFYTALMMVMGDSIEGLTTQGEYFFSSLVVLIGACMNATIFANVANLVAQMGAYSAKHKMRMDAIHRAMRSLKVDETSQNRISAYFDYCWVRHHDFAGHDFVQQLPFQLRKRVAIQVHERKLRQVPLFAEVEGRFLAALATYLIPEVYLPEEYILVAGMVSRSAYIVDRGRVQVICTDMSSRLEIQSMRKDGGHRHSTSHVVVRDDYFGEVGLFIGKQHTYSVRAMTHVDAFRLSRQSFESVMQDHPSAAVHVADQLYQILPEDSAKRAAMNIYEVVGMRSLLKVFQPGRWRPQRGLAAKIRELGENADGSFSPALQRLRKQNEASARAKRAQLRSSAAAAESPVRAFGADEESRQRRNSDDGPRRRLGSCSGGRRSSSAVGGGGEGGGGGGDYEGVRAAQQRLEGKIDEIYRMLRTQKTRDDA